MSKKRILVLEGGFNEEHKVSLSTGKEVKKAILKLGYYLESVLVNPKNFNKVVNKYEVDICFNALHGTFGEDGKIQQILYDNKIKFTHSGIQASKISFNKLLTKKAIKNTEVNFLDSIFFNKSELNADKYEELYNKLSYFVLKPVSSGSSYGVQIINSLDDINFYLKQKNLYKNHENLMAEPYIIGRELTVTVIEENGVSKAIDVTEIRSNNLFFDYQAKYTKGFSKHILPAEIPIQVYEKCLNYSKIVHDTLGCRGISRSDFLYSEKDNKLFFLEINTQPGLTLVSLVPEQLVYNNIDFITIIENLLKASSCQS